MKRCRVLRVAICDRFNEIARGESRPGSNQITNIRAAAGAMLPVGRLLQIVPLNGRRIGSSALMRVNSTSGATAILDGALAA